MSDKHSEHSEEQHIGIPGYLGVFAILIVGTVLTYVVALKDLDFIFIVIVISKSSKRKILFRIQSILNLVACR